MPEKLPRGGQAVRAADGTYLGRLLQCDERFIFVARSWWRLDFCAIPSEEVAASGGGTLILRCLAGDVRPETAEPWAPAPDPLGNANGVDVEPLRAGMAEIDGAPVVTSSGGMAALGGTPLAPSSAPRTGAPASLARPDPPLPSPEDIESLDRARIARIDAQVDRYIAAELEDLQIAASCETPPGFEHAASYEVAFALELTSPVHRPATHRARVAFSVPARDGAALVRATDAPAPVRSPVGREAAHSATALERTLLGAGFSRVEAAAIASGGYEALVALRSVA